MRFEEAFQGWSGGRLTQTEAAMLLGQCERSFRRHVERYKADGLEGLLDKRLSQISKRRAGLLEVDRVVQTYKSGFAGWSVAHVHSKYRSELQGTRSYSWVKTVLQGAGLAKKAKSRGKHRIKRERAPLPGMMLHQDASTHMGYADDTRLRESPVDEDAVEATLSAAVAQGAAVYFTDEARVLDEQGGMIGTARY